MLVPASPETSPSLSHAADAIRITKGLHSDGSNDRITLV